MNAVYENAIGDAGAALITHIGLVDETGTELTGGSYARIAVTWTAAGNGADPDGTIRPDANLTFDVPAGESVAGWRGYSASTAGTDYGGEDLDQEDFTNAGEYTLLADQTSIAHNVPA